MKAVLTLFLFLLSFTPVLASNTEALETYIQQTIAQWNVPGLAVGIIKDGKIIYMKGFGVRELGKPEKIDPNTLFRIASVSKTFASALVGTYVDEGKLHWNDKVIQYLPELKPQKSEILPHITLKHVLSNSTGFPRHTYTHMLDAAVPYNDILPKLDNVKPVCKPGECHSYQNVVFSLSGQVCEVLTGKSYAQLLNERVFVPLGMNRTSASCQDFKSAKNKAMPHKKKGKGFTPLDSNCRYYDVGPAAGVNTTLSDLLIWADEILSSRQKLLSSTTSTEILSPAIETPDEIQRWNMHWRKTRVKKADYGLGWRLFNYAGTSMLYHGGGVQGYSAVLALLPQQKTGIIVLANIGKSFVVNSIMARFIDAELGLDPIDYNELRDQRNERAKKDLKKKK